MLNLGETFPNLKASTTIGDIDLYEYIGNNWAILCSHPADFTPVCTTEIGRMSQLSKEFEKRNVKVLIISCDSVSDHKSWVKDVNKFSGCEVTFPLIGDENGIIANKIGMLDMGADKMQTVRSVFVIGPDKKVKATINYPASTGRNFDEIIRLIDSLQLTASRGNVVTPADWKVGGDVLVRPGNEMENAVPIELPSGKNYLKFVKSTGN